MRIKHLIVSLSSIVVVFLIIVYVIVRTTGTALPSNTKSITPITPIPVDSSKLPEALQKIQNKARQSNSNDLQLVGAPIATNPGNVNQPTPSTTEASLSPTKVPTAKPVQ